MIRKIWSTVGVILLFIWFAAIGWFFVSPFALIVVHIEGERFSSTGWAKLAFAWILSPVIFLILPGVWAKMDDRFRRRFTT